MTLTKTTQPGRMPVHVEVARPDELPPATAAITVHPDRDVSGRFTAGNTVAKSKRLKPGPRGLTNAEQTAPDYQPFSRWGRRYGAHRRRELASAHGGELSAGVGAIVESAALAMAASRYLTHLAGQTGDADLFQRAARLAESARQHELAAWELAAREAASRPRTQRKSWEVDEASAPAPPATRAPAPAGHGQGMG